MIIIPSAVLCLINLSLIGDREKLIDPLGVAQKKRLSLRVAVNAITLTFSGMTL